MNISKFGLTLASPENMHLSSAPPSSRWSRTTLRRLDIDETVPWMKVHFDSGDWVTEAELSSWVDLCKQPILLFNCRIPISSQSSPSSLMPLKQMSMVLRNDSSRILGPTSKRRKFISDLCIDRTQIKETTDLNYINAEHCSLC